MTPSRWSTVLRRVTTEGPYINETDEYSRPHRCGAGGDLCRGLRGQIRGPSFARSSVFPALALSALVHPLRISLALSIVCLVLHDLVDPMRDLGTRTLIKGRHYPSWICFRCRRCEPIGSAATTASGIGRKTTRRTGKRNSVGCRGATRHPASVHSKVPGFDLAARMYPAKTVAGDYYGFIQFPAGEIAVVIADVSGKGVAAGLLMPSIEVALRMNAPRFPSTSDLLQLFNNVVCQVTERASVYFAVLWKALPTVAFLGIYKRGTQSAAADSRRHRSESTRQRRPSAGCASRFELRE